MHTAALIIGWFIIAFLLGGFIGFIGFIGFRRNCRPTATSIDYGAEEGARIFEDRS